MDCTQLSRDSAVCMVDTCICGHNGSSVNPWKSCCVFLFLHTCVVSVLMSDDQLLPIGVATGVGHMLIVLTTTLCSGISKCVLFPYEIAP